MELIDRRGVMKVLDEAKIKTTSEEYDRIIDVIGSMPTINRWIPVTERLPEEEGDYFTTQIDENGKEISRVAYYENEWFTRFEVIAWMPLPKPYEGSDRDAEKL